MEPWVVYLGWCFASLALGYCGGAGHRILVQIAEAAT